MSVIEISCKLGCNTNLLYCIFNLSIVKGICPQPWKIANIIPLSKNSNVALSGTSGLPISLLPLLSKLMERIIFEQTQSYFVEDNFNSFFQHAYRKGFSAVNA